jgi:ABC-type Na+ efflux pump permease subunit
VSGIDLGRLLAMARKELREFRRTPFILGAMVVLPVIFIVEPLIDIFRLGSSTPAGTVQKVVGVTFLLMLIVPAVLPSTIAAYSVIGERDQGTLEPLLTTPVRRSELLLGKALAAMIPSVLASYVIFAVVLLCAHLFASNQTVVATLSNGTEILAEVLFALLVSGWSIAVGTGISARASDVRIAQQLGTLASLPPLAVTALVSFQVLSPSVPVAVGFGLGLLVIDIAMWRVVAAMFDRERLITGARALAAGAGGDGAQPPGTARRIDMVPGGGHE